MQLLAMVPVERHSNGSVLDYQAAFGFSVLQIGLVFGAAAALSALPSRRSH